MTTLPKNELCKKSISSNQDLFSHEKCKSTTYVESKKSRITKSFIRTNYATVVSSSSNINNDEEKYFKDNKKTFCTNQQLHITEFKEEDGSSKDDKIENPNRIITFSICINKHTLVTSDTTPVILKEAFEINTNDTLSKAIIIFFRLLNKTTKDKGYKFIVPKISKITDSEFQVKPMKKSGKPDFDLPGFDLETPIKNFGFNAFSVVFKEHFVSNAYLSEIFEEKIIIPNKEKGFDQNKTEQSNVITEVEVNKKKLKQVSVNKDSSSCCNSCVVF